MRLFTRSLATLSLGAVALALLSACGGGSDAIPPPVDVPPPVVTVTGLTGSVAVGAPMTSGKLRMLDASGAVAAHDIEVDADGTYDAGVPLGSAPWRIEACGYAGASYGCLYAVARTVGTANVTPLTSALIVLATGQSPDSIMQDGASAPTAAALDAAQVQLQTSLASTLSDAGVAANFDFTVGQLAAGTHTGYDRILDAINVSTGTDDVAFVQVAPRTGDGNLYLTTGVTTGSITTAPAAVALPLGELETLFAKMTAAVVSIDTCHDANIGLTTVIAGDARMNRLAGGAEVAASLCNFFDHGDGGSGPMWGSRLVSPTLGKCDFTATDPLCAVRFSLQDADGNVEDTGNGLGVVYRDHRWQFHGDLLPVAINANAAIQRGVRVDDPTTPIQYGRAFQFDIARTDGVACAVVNALDDAHSTLAIYKPFSQDVERMSLWASDGFGNSASTDPNVGSLRAGDDTWMQLPQGSAGDEVIRRFYRAGRTVRVSLYSDSACSAPALVEGKSAFDVDIAGMPPVDSALVGQAWGTLSADTVTALETLTLDSDQAGSFTASWTFAGGVAGFDHAQLCTSGSCDDGSDARLGDKALHANVRTVVMPLEARVAPLAAGDFKMYALGGHDVTGMNIQSSFFSCTSAPLGQMCGQGPAQNGDANSAASVDGAPTSGPSRRRGRAH